MLLHLTRTAAENPAAALTLPNICAILVLSLMAAGAVWFFELCKEKGMALRWYAYALTYWLWYKTRPKYGRYEVKYKTVQELIANNWKPRYAGIIVKRRAWYYTALYKVLGGCVWCFGTWLATFIYALVAPLFGLSFAVLLALWLPYIGANYIFMEAIYKLKK